MLDGFIYSLQFNDQRLFFGSISRRFSPSILSSDLLISRNNESGFPYMLVEWKEILYKHLPVIKMQQIYFGLGSVSLLFQEKESSKQKKNLLKQVGWH